MFKAFWLNISDRTSPGMGFTNIEDVSLEWDGNPEIRERLRDGGQALPNPAGQDITTCVKNSVLLVPLLNRMSSEKKRTVPSIDQLIDELEALLQKNKRGVDLGGEDIPKCAWALRKLCGFVKMKARRREVSTAARLHKSNPPLSSCQYSFRPKRLQVVLLYPFP